MTETARKTQTASPNAKPRARNTKKAAPPAPVRRTSNEVRQWYDQNKPKFVNYADTATANDAIKLLRDVTKTSTKPISAFNKDSLRTYLQNIGTNEKNLRNLSRYLYYRSPVYHRLIMYNANMFCLNARSVIPQYDITGNNDATSVLKNYNDTLTLLEKLNLQFEMLKAYTICFREDVFYGCVYFDDESMFILPLDPDYCKISGYYNTGDFSFDMDMSYFRSKQELLEYWGEPFQSMYSAYESEGNSGKWQPMPDEYAICLKARAEDWETIVPLFSGLFNALINLIDLEDIQAIADEQQIYKLVWLEMETLTNSNMPDDWKVNPKIMIEYFNRLLEEALPSYTSGAIVPGKLNTISFDNDQATDTNKIAKATETVLNTSGGAQILNSATISGTTAFEAAVRSDTEFAISMLLPQTQAWLNRWLTYQLSTPARVKFFEVSAYTIDAFKKNLLTDAQYGLPVKLVLNNMNGFSELDTLALNFLEEECLQLSNKFVPLQSSHTQNGDPSSEAGAPTKDSDELTDDGEASRDKKDKAKL